jgi:hypothetical protein
MMSDFVIAKTEPYLSCSSNPLAPGRRSKLCWTEEEEQALRVRIPQTVFTDD